MKKILWLILCMCMLSSCKKAENVMPENDPLLIGSEDKYELVALATDKQGIDKASVFQLTSKEEINNNFIKNNIMYSP